MKFLLSTILFLLSLQGSVNAQYPFEQFKKISYKNVDFKRDSTRTGNYKFSARSKKYTIVMQENADSNYTTVSIYNRGKLAKKFQEYFGMLDITLSETMQVADINGDGYEDFKITIYNDGAGLAGSLENKLYLFGSKTGFHKLSFIDYFNFSEVDIDGDGNYEIIGCDLINYQNHNYWTFDLNNYTSGKFQNVSRKYGYPIMVQYLLEENYKVTRNISKAKMRIFSKKQPGKKWD